MRFYQLPSAAAINVKSLMLISSVAILAIFAVFTAIPKPACHTEREIKSEADYREARAYRDSGNVMTSLDALERADATTRSLIRGRSDEVCSEVASAGH